MTREQLFHLFHEHWTKKFKDKMELSDQEIESILKEVESLIAAQQG